jgi:1-acyl-sn-glycerol-3-phosphate acyltransferase
MTDALKAYILRYSLLRKTMALVKLFVFIVMILCLIPVHLIVYLLTKSMIVPRWFHRWSCFIFNVKAHWSGEAFQNDKVGRPVVYMANHLSYLDIIVLGAKLDASFVAKSDVADWPVFGFLSKLQQTIFISRKPQGLKKAQVDILEELAKGKNLILFPEGTSTRGDGVKPFKSSLFTVFMDEQKPLIVPVGISFLSVEGQSSDAYDLIINKGQGIESTSRGNVPEMLDFKGVYTWFGDMELAPHLWRLAQLLRVDVAVSFAPALHPQDFDDRKTLAQATYEAVISARHKC